MMSATFDIVLFGGGGDLSLRKLMPALYRAHVEAQLASDLRIIATVLFDDASLRQNRQSEHFIGEVKSALQSHLQPGEFCLDQWQAFSQRIAAVALDIVNVDKGWAELAKLMGQSTNHSLFYFAIPPSLYSTACQNLSSFALVDSDSRVIVEKPIGYNRDSAQQINQQVGQHFSESNIYRIDHYLGKETVQNLMVLRFSNFLFEHLWDARSIDHVQITLAETVGLEGRASFYDKAGAVRDMVQNHLLQLLCLVAMEPANDLSADAVRAEKIKVLNALRKIEGDDIAANTVRGQYHQGEVMGQVQSGYLDELGDPSSQTETFVAIRAHIDNWRWAGVPFYLRTGKCLQQQFSEIVIQFKAISHRVFGADAGPLSANRLIVRLQPDENIQLQLTTKDLDRTKVHLQKVDLNLNHETGQQDVVRDCYKRLLLDALRGDPTLFIHRDEIDASWRWLDPMLEGYKAANVKPFEYAAGSWGPTQADELLAKDGFHWRNDITSQGTQ